MPGIGGRLPVRSVMTPAHSRIASCDFSMEYKLHTRSILGCREKWIKAPSGDDQSVGRRGIARHGLIPRVLLDEIPERHGVTQRADGGYAVFPPPACLATQKVCGARAEILGGPFPAFSLLATQSQGACRRKRDSDDIAEHRLVPAAARCCG